MNRRTAVVLVSTFLFLVAASLWVPLVVETNFREVGWPGPNPALEVGPWRRSPYQTDPPWGWVWQVGRHRYPWDLSNTRIEPPGAHPGGRTAIHWPWFLLQLGTVSAYCGLLYLGLRLRDRRRAQA